MKGLLVLFHQVPKLLDTLAVWREDPNPQQLDVKLHVSDAPTLSHLHSTLYS